MSAQKGFSLIEAIVALVVFTMTVIGVYAWISTNITTLNRITDVAQTEWAVGEAMERLKLVDLFKEQQGSFEVDTYQVNWSASLAEPEKHGVAQTGAIGLYDLGLYRITLTLGQGGRSAQYVYHQAAFKKVREMQRMSE